MTKDKHLYLVRVGTFQYFVMCTSDEMSESFLDIREKVKKNDNGPVLFLKLHLEGLDYIRDQAEI